jgi:hypothetical protein
LQVRGYKRSEMLKSRRVETKRRKGGLFGIAETLTLETPTRLPLYTLREMMNTFDKEVLCTKKTLKDWKYPRGLQWFHTV